MGNVIDILLARLKCNLYCTYQIFRHLKSAQELIAYDKNNDVILVAATNDVTWENATSKDTVFGDMKVKLGWKISIDKVFYEVKNEAN